MTNITFDRTEFESYVTLTDDVIQKISLFGTPLERLTDDEIEIEIFPNRPDLISLQGFMRGFLAFLGKKGHTGLRSYKLKQADTSFSVTVDPSVKKVRPFTRCAIVKGIEFTDERIKEIIRLQEKIHITTGRNRKKVAIGIYPLEHITLPIRYTARDPKDISFQPLESEREMDGHEILELHPTGKEYAHLLASAKQFPLFVDAKDNILSMPPIINSHDTGRITEQTTDIFIECSGFDEQILSRVLTIITTTLADMNGTIHQMNITDGTETITSPDFSERTMDIELSHVNKLLGLTLQEKDLQTLLPRMGYDYTNGMVSIPPWRTDIFHEVDIIEDVAIAYGYDALQPQIPNVATVGEESEISKKSAVLSSLLIGLGYQEILTYHFLKQNEEPFIPTDQKVELEESKTEYKFLRHSLLIPALRILSENTHHEYPQYLFEIGTVFIPDKSQVTGIREEEHLLVISAPGNFTRSKQVLDYVTRMREETYSLEETTHPLTIEGRTGSVHIKNTTVGIIGEIHPSTIENQGLEVPISFFEVCIDKIL